MTEVARKSGFGSADRMGRVFMRKLSISPSDYRKQVLSGADVVPATPNMLDTHAKPAAFHQITRSQPRKKSDALAVVDG
jgi:AraC-like DNA-binding protein